MAYILVLPEYGLVADPMIGIITTAGVSFAPILEKIDILEDVTEDMVNMLSGQGNYLASFPNRDMSLKIAGSMNSFWYGLAIGLLIAGVIAFQLIKVG